MWNDIQFLTHYWYFVDPFVCRVYEADDDSDDDSDDEVDDKFDVSFDDRGEVPELIDGDVPDLVDSREEEKDPSFHVPGQAKVNPVDHHQTFLGDVGAIAQLIKGLEVNFWDHDVKYAVSY